MTLLAIVALTVASAASPAPAPQALATPPPFAAHARAAVRLAGPDRNLDATLRIAVAQRAGSLRFDVLGITSEALPLPPLAATVVVDGRSRAVTVWSETTKRYWRFVPRPGASPTPAPRATPAPARSPAPPRAPLLGLLDLFEMTLRLTGHSTVVGLPATGFSFDVQSRTKVRPESMHVSGTAQLSDELLVPLAAEVVVEPGGAAGERPLRINLSYAVEDFARTLPAGLSFAVPAGYTEATSFMAVIMPSAPH